MENIIEIPSAVARKVILSFEPAEVDTYIDKAIKEIAKDVNINGFRKGKVPAKVIEQRFASDVQSRANDTLVNQNVQKILAENNLHPISRIEFAEIENNDASEFARNKAYKFAFSFEILPEIELPELEKLTVNQLQPQVTEKDKEDFNYRVAQSSAKLEPVTEERNPQIGDICLVDVNGTINGAVISGMSGENIHIQLKEETQERAKELEAIVRSLKVGESKTGKMTVPDDYPDPSLRGQEMEMFVKLHSISKEILPELTEELVKKFGFQTLEVYNNFVQSSILNEKETKIKRETEHKLLNSVLEKLNFVIPPSLIETHKREFISETAAFMQKQGDDIEKISEVIKNLEEEALTKATTFAKEQTFLLALAFKEKVTISEQELYSYISSEAKQIGKEPKELLARLHETGVINDIQERLLAAKALELMYKRANKILVDENDKPIEIENKTE